MRDHFGPRLLWVRSLHPVYNPQLAIRILAGPKEIYPDVTLVMIGSDKAGMKVKLTQFATANGVAENLLITGRLAKSDWIAEAARCDIFINTTNFDHMPVSVMEATVIGTASYYFEVKKRKYLGVMSGAHNKIIRSFTEHGFNGGVIWLLFSISSLVQVNKRKGFYRHIAMVFFLVFLASTFHNGLKLALQSLILMIAVASRPTQKPVCKKNADVKRYVEQRTPFMTAG